MENLLTAEGLTIDPEIIEMPQTTDKRSTTISVHCKLLYVKLYHHMSDDCEVLQQLTHKDTVI